MRAFIEANLLRYLNTVQKPATKIGGGVRCQNYQNQVKEGKDQVVQLYLIKDQ